MQYQWVTKLDDAAIVLRYGGDAGSTVAKAFFPNDHALNVVWVYALAFDNDIIQYQTNIYQHELGHTKGLRHEFADQEGGAVLFGPKNENSIMSYNFPMYL